MRKLIPTSRFFNIFLFVFLGTLLLGSFSALNSSEWVKILILITMIIFAVFLIVLGFISNSFYKIIVGIFLFFFVAAIDIIFFIHQELIYTQKFEYFFLSICGGLLAINVMSYLLHKKIMFWIFPIFVMFFSSAVFLISNSFRLIDYIFFLGVGTGISLLGCGLYWKLFGLVIPGSLLIGTCAGVYFAWAQSFAKNALVQTGVMLVWMALGWGFVTIFSRVRTYKFLWWPLIPGGVFAMVGWGLYIGGNPGNALPFIGNTGSIGLLIFGIYILLLRRGIHR